MRRRHSQSGMFQSVLFLMVFVIIIVAAIVVVNNKPLPATRSQPQVQGESSFVRAHVMKVYDGDTIKLSNGEKIRFIGIDTPELHDNPKLFRDAKKSGLDVETIKRMGQGRMSLRAIFWQTGMCVLSSMPSNTTDTVGCWHMSILTMGRL